MAFPVRSVARPAALTGQANGRLTPGVLKATPGQAGGPVVELVEPAARAWRALCAAAKGSGHTLKISGPGSAYRNLATQEAIFTQRYTTTPNGTPPRLWKGRRWYKRPGVAAAAVPGTSNHGWGLAADVGEERDRDAGTESLDQGTLGWLLAHEQTFGFSHEIQSEPWHIRYFAGDRIASAVLAYEHTLTARPEPAPPSPPEDDDMPLIIKAKGRPTRLKDGPTCSPLDALSLWNTAAAGVRQVELSPESYDAMLGHVGEALGRPVVKAITELEAAVAALDA